MTCDTPLPQTKAARHHAIEVNQNCSAHNADKGRVRVPHYHCKHRDQHLSTRTTATRTCFVVAIDMATIMNKKKKKTLKKNKAYNNFNYIMTNKSDA